jgi:thiol-disulfide isomerase/thioredoxin
MKKYILIFSLLILLIIALFINFKDIFKVDLNLEKYENSKTYKNYLTDNKLVVINNWASWCEPCVEEISLLNSLEDKFGDKVHFLAFSHDRDTIKTQEAIKKYHFTWKEITLYDYKYRIAIKNNFQNGILRINELPYTYFIKNGKVILKTNGKLDSLKTINFINEHLK